MSRGPLVASISDRMNDSVIDEWTLVHAMTGAAAAAIGMSGWTFVLLAMGYEVLEYYHESPRGSAIFGSKGAEWEPNMVMDLAVAMGAFSLVAWATRPPNAG